MSKKKNKKITISPEFCTGCLRCSLACSFFTSTEKAFNISKSKIMVVPFYNMESFEITLKNDCDLCGICVQYCEFDALVIEKLADGFNQMPEKV
ncbi:MAG: 4Fe-4S binding protein [Proteobacteria bacterium]|nr:4Fe-4S binding protein [Pseudomonadota bacterium]